MDYKITPQSGNSYSHMWDVASTKTFDGGFLLDKSNLPAGLEKLPKGVFLKGDLNERIAKVVKTAVLQADVTGTSVRVKKGSLLKSGDVVGIGDKAVAVGAINTSNAEYDSFTITADALGAAKAGDMLISFDGTGEGAKPLLPNGLNPSDDVKIDAQPSVSIMYAADGIVKSRLPQAVTPEIESALKFCQFLDV